MTAARDGVVRVGVIGAGGIAQMMHLPHLFERPDRFELVSLADVNEKTLQAVGRHYRVPHLTRDFRELCTRPDVDAVLLLASGMHREPALAALGAGKHLFVEKPLGFSMRETEELAGAARQSGKGVLVGYHKRFDPGYLRAREAVRALEDVRYVEVTVLHPDDGAYRSHHVIWPEPDQRSVPSPEASSNQRTADAVSQGPLLEALEDVVGKGAPVAHRVAAKILFESLIHDLNAVRGILGEPEEVVSSHVWRDGFAQTSVTRFAGDLRVNASWIAVPGLRHYEERLRFVGPKGRVTLTFPSAYLRNVPSPLEIERMDGDELVIERRTVSYEEAFRAELHHFRDCVLSGQKPSVSVEDAMADARWIHAIAARFPGR